MTTAITAPKDGVNLTSTNGIGNLLTLALLAAAAVFGINEDVITALIAAAVPFGFFVREIIEGKRKARWAGNIATYLASAVVLIAPWLEGLLDVAKPAVDAAVSGNTNMIWTLLIPIVNEVLLIVKNKPWVAPTA